MRLGMATALGTVSRSTFQGLALLLVPTDGLVRAVLSGTNRTGKVAAGSGCAELHCHFERHGVRASTVRQCGSEDGGEGDTPPEQPLVGNADTSGEDHAAFLDLGE